MIGLADEGPLWMISKNDSARARQVEGVSRRRQGGFRSHMAIEVLSVHFPKAGGTALLRSFQAAFGKDAVLADYHDDPVDPCSRFHIDPQGCRRHAQQAIELPEIRVIHGHFNPLKYQYLNNGCRVTFLRHPIDNLISIYYYWKTYQPKSSLFRNLLRGVSNSAKRLDARRRHGIFDYFHQHQLTLLQMAELPALRYLLSRTYFGGVDLSSFDFIGFAESYPRDIRALSQFLSVPLDESRSHKNRFPDYLREREILKADRKLMNRLQDLLKEDLLLYERLWSQSERALRAS